MNTSTMKKDKIKFVDAMTDLIKYERNWCQGELARDEHGLMTHARSIYAVAWCLSGCMLKVLKDNPEYGLDMPTASTLVSKDIRALLPDGIGMFNDLSSHAEVMDFLFTYRKSLT